MPDLLKKSRYKWYILVLAMLAYGIVTGMDRMCLPVLFKEISLDLNLSMVSIGTIWGMDPLAGVFVSLPGGLLADRFGVKRTLTVACLLAGVFCALRGFSANFLTMAATSFIFGLMATVVFTVAPKTTVVWFSRSQLGMANVFLQIFMTIGSMSGTMLSATVLSPLLGGWRNVLFLLGAPSVLVGFLWLFTGREPQKSESSGLSASSIPLGQALSRVIRIKEVWVWGFLQLTFMGSMTGFGGYLALYLRNMGWTDVASDTAVTVVTAMGLIGMIPMVLLANRLHAQKPFFVFSMLALSLGLIVLPFIRGNWIFVLLILSGFLRSGAPALSNTLVMQIKGVGGTYGGTAMGLTTTIGMLGAFAAPPLGNSLESIDPGLPIIFWGLLALASLPLSLMIRDKKLKSSTDTSR
ncbi:MAG: MFS transporter [Dehalococcoidales bacterium]|nr:MFS transporter [Dehalococcoidales bacterium]